MSEEWKEEFFEWKDEIEGKFNNLSQKHLEFEKWKKIEEEQHQNITKALDNFVIDAGAIGDSVYSNKLKTIEEQIAELKEKIDAWIDDIRIGNKQRFNLEEVLREHYKQKINRSEQLIEGYSEDDDEVGDDVVYIKHDLQFYKKQLEKLDSDPVQNRIDRLDAGLEVMKEHEKFITDSKTEKKDSGIDVGGIRNGEIVVGGIKYKASGGETTEVEKTESIFINDKDCEKLSDSKLPELKEERDCFNCKFEIPNNQDICSKNCFIKTNGYRSAWKPKTEKKDEKWFCVKAHYLDENGECHYCDFKKDSGSEKEPPEGCVEIPILSNTKFIPKKKPKTELTRSSELLNKLDDKGVEMESVLQTKPEDVIVGVDAVCRKCGFQIHYHLKDGKRLIEEFLDDMDGVPIGCSKDDEIKYLKWIKPLKVKWRRRFLNKQKEVAGRLEE